MPSIRANLAKQLVKAIGLKGRLRRLAAVDRDPAMLERGLRKLRRTDRRSPPWIVRRRWKVESVSVDGFDLYVMTRPETARAARVVLYLHGGGYLFGPFITEWAAMRRVAASSGADFAMFLYPRAPEHRAMDTLEATRRAFAVLAARYGPSGVVVVGTSAGGGLAVALLNSLRDEGAPMPPCAVLISPGVDMTLRRDVGSLEQSDAILSVAHVRSAGRLYGGNLGAEHPVVSPLFGALSDLPALWVFAGGDELLLPSIETFAEEARSAGTPVDLVVAPGQQHTYPLVAVPEGREALARIADIVASCG